MSRHESGIVLVAIVVAITLVFAAWGIVVKIREFRRDRAAIRLEAEREREALLLMQQLESMPHHGTAVKWAWEIERRQRSGT